MHLELAALTGLKYFCTASFMPHPSFRHSKMGQLIAARLLDTAGWKEVLINISPLYYKRNILLIYLITFLLRILIHHNIVLYLNIYSELVYYSNIAYH